MNEPRHGCKPAVPRPASFVGVAIEASATKESFHLRVHLQVLLKAALAMDGRIPGDAHREQLNYHEGHH
ncbi:MAG TPA: hypothetical protein VE621_06405 [Bryobacteraceae bacterium]|nr:hypothetical protein [Bryobacteraceae bacterium]